ncbi:MAG: PilZ domain-containing protein [Rhodocyclaceae bacterium]|nr:PilZ domain-containing protein [Rhodocyclaceae bacterium]
MNRSATTTLQRSERRELPRHYLTRPMRAELVWGRQRFGVASGAIADLSKAGLGLRTARRMGIAPGAMVTVAIPRQDKVLTLSGTVAASRGGYDIGISLDGNPLFEMLGGELDSVSVSLPQDGKARLCGSVTLNARHPIGWAIAAGARRFDMGAASALDSSGIGMLLQFNERHGVTVGNCAPQVCRLIKLCGTPALCAGDCRKA